MGNIILYIISLIFGACCAFLMLVAKVFGLTYTEASLFVNIYAQYGVLLLSGLSIVFAATKKIIRGCMIAIWHLSFANRTCGRYA